MPPADAGKDDSFDYYINASYISLYKSNIGMKQLWAPTTLAPRSIIATQGPLRSSVQQFWRMIIHEKIEQIYMLCNLIENLDDKCFKYFPD